VTNPRLRDEARSTVSITFADLGVPADLVDALAQRGITAPFEVQAATIPDLLAGRDVCGRAPTGSGKTLAFGIPLLARIGKAQPKKPRALVLAPTRELAAQIQRDLEPLAVASGRSVYAVYGGVGYEPQRRALRRGVDVLVACPGRLHDLVEQHAVRLDSVSAVVIDEADRMADMGFLPQVRKLLDATNEARQTVLFSATLDGAVAVLTREYQDNPSRHEVGAAEPDIMLADHWFWKVEPAERTERTADLISAHGPTIVFCRTRHGVDRVVKTLEKTGVRAAGIHGGRSQGQRDRALRSFTDGHVSALVATDVAARGIHVDDVACVVHFDLPADGKDYLHRSGRTARAGATGVVVSLVARHQARDAKRLQRSAGLAVDLEHPPSDAIGVERPSMPAVRVERRERSSAAPRGPRHGNVQRRGQGRVQGRGQGRGARGRRN
jgi:superfamily II DNA/RNA helicase